MRAFQPQHVPKPTGWTGQPPALPAGNIDLEIGCGVGWHPIRYARENPARTLIAIEHTAGKFRLFQSRLAHHAPMANLWPVHANAISWVTHCLPPRCLSRVLILYPNPTDLWFQRPFFGRLLESVADGGEILLATNLDDVMHHAKRSANETWGLGLSRERRFGQADKPPECPRTHFEKKYLLRGETCSDATWVKTGT